MQHKHETHHSWGIFCWCMCMPAAACVSISQRLRGMSGGCRGCHFLLLLQRSVQPRSPAAHLPTRRGCFTWAVGRAGFVARHSAAPLGASWHRRREDKLSLSASQTGRVANAELLAASGAGAWRAAGGGARGASPLPGRSWAGRRCAAAARPAGTGRLL